MEMQQQRQTQTKQNMYPMYTYRPVTHPSIPAERAVEKKTKEVCFQYHKRARTPIFLFLHRHRATYEGGEEDGMGVGRRGGSGGGDADAGVCGVVV